MRTKTKTIYFKNDKRNIQNEVEKGKLAKTALQSRGPAIVFAHTNRVRKGKGVHRPFWGQIKMPV